MQTLIHTPTPNLSQSLGFYQSLGFKSLTTEIPLIVTDGKVFIEINPDRYARAGVKLYATDWSSTVEELKRFCAITKSEAGYLCSDPSGVWLYLIEGVAPEFGEQSDDSYSALGKYAGLSLETTDIERSLSIWKLIGFDKVSGAIEQGWLSCTNADGVTVSLMKPNACPHLFFNPSLTYFNGGNNLPVIQKIRDAGIPIAEEITVFNQEGLVDNVIIRDPGGYGFFIFND